MSMKRAGEQVFNVTSPARKVTLIILWSLRYIYKLRLSDANVFVGRAKRCFSESYWKMWNRKYYGVRNY